MRFFASIKKTIWDLLLCLVMASSVSISIQAGFNALETPAAYCASTACCALLLMVLFLLSRSGRNMLVMLAAYVGVSLMLLVLAASLSTSGSLVTDSSDNHVIPLLIIIVATVIVYALTRRVGTCVVMFIIGFVACVLIQFLYRENHVIADVTFVLSALTMIAYRNFESSLRSANVAAKTSLGSGFASATAMALAVVLMSAGVFFVVIVPLNPQAATLKIIQEYRKLPEILAHNPLEVSDKIDPSFYSSKYDDDKRTTTYQKAGDDGVSVPAEGNKAPNDTDKTLDGTYTDLDQDSQQQAFDVLDLGTHSNFPFLILIIIFAILLIAAIIAAKIFWRRRWYRKVCEKNGRCQVMELYEFFLSRFTRVGLGKAAVQTPLEYAVANELSLSVFTETSEVPYRALTDTFMNVTYGHDDPTGEQLTQFHRYYRGFYRGCRDFLGRFKYARKFFFL